MASAPPSNGRSLPGSRATPRRSWITSAFGLTRILLAIALRDQNAAPAATATTALVLILIRNVLRTLRQLMPAGNFAVLNSPLAAPSFLIDFLTASSTGRRAPTPHSSPTRASA